MRPTNVINEIKNGSTAQLEQVFASYEAQGMPIVYEETTYHLQCRPLDRTNWLGVMAMANLLDSDLDTVTIMTFENVPITLTKPQVLQAMANVGIYSQALYGARWATKQAISNGTTSIQATFSTALQNILNP